jgi:oxygen-dependent protoporphyrinogen oxidase
VVGAGISGLACAFRLRQLGIRPVLLEATGNTGGLISTLRRNGFLFEGGPQCPRFSELLWTLVREMRLEKEFLAGDPKARRYILRNGRLYRAPFSMGTLLGTGLLGLNAKYRLLSEGLRHSQPPLEEETLAGFVQRKFGAEILDFLVDPFVSTVFFCDPRTMGMDSAFPALVQWERSRGSLTRGAIAAYKSKLNVRRPHDSTPSPQKSPARLAVTEALPALGSFRHGMSTLTEALSESLREHLHCRTRVACLSLDSTSSAPERSWRLRLEGGEELVTGAVVLALPAYAAAAVLQRVAPALCSRMAAIEHSPLGVVSSAYRRADVRHALDGFGFMVPRAEALATICTFWNSSLFPERAPRDAVLMTSYTRVESAAALRETSEEGLAQQVAAENAGVLGITAPPLDRAVWKYPQALPQYNVGHARRLAEIRADLAELPRLYLAGNFLNGRSIGDCVDSGFRAAEQLRNATQA